MHHNIDSQQTIVTQVGVTEYQTTKLPDQTKTDETVVYTTLTSLCPYTTTVTESGNVITKVLTSTSTIVTNVAVVETETDKLPDQTVTEHDVAFTTLTSLCPYTTTVTENGEVVTKTLTSTSTIVTQVDKTYSETVYTTSATTAYETTDVYVTQEYPVTSYTTVVEGSTTVVVETNTHYLSVTKVYTTTVSFPFIPPSPDSIRSY